MMEKLGQEARRAMLGHLVVFLIWIDLVIFLRWRWDWDLLWLWLGGLVGTFLLDIDYLVYMFFTAPQEPGSFQGRSLLLQKKIVGIINFIADTHRERVRLSLHNVFFHAVLLAVCFWVLSSTSVIFVKGLTMAMALHLLHDELGSVREGQAEELRRGFFWPINVELSFGGMRAVILAMGTIFVIMNMLLIRQ